MCIRDRLNEIFAGAAPGIAPTGGQHSPTGDRGRGKCAIIYALRSKKSNPPKYTSYSKHLKSEQIQIKLCALVSNKLLKRLQNFVKKYHYLAMLLIVKYR